MMERTISAFPDYRVLLVQDITAYEQETAGQMKEYLMVCCGILAAAVLYGILGKVLRPLGVLTDAVQKLGEGDLKVWVLVKGKDEMGVLAQAFNQMTDRVEGQVEDLRLLLGALTHEIKTPMTHHHRLRGKPALPDTDKRTAGKCADGHLPRRTNAGEVVREASQQR